MRFELTTLTLARLCSTPELRPLASGPGGRALVMSQAGFCNLYRKNPKFPALAGAFRAIAAHYALPGEANKRKKKARSSVGSCCCASTFCGRANKTQRAMMQYSNAIT